MLLKVQVSAVIFDTFPWRDGVFPFYDKVPAPATAVTLEMDVQNLIVEGIRRLDDPARALEAFQNRDQVVESVANPQRVKQSVTLLPEEWQVYFLVDGRRSVAEIVTELGTRYREVPDEEVRRFLSRLVARRCVELPGKADGADG